MTRRFLLLLAFGVACENGSNERDIAQLRAELEELRAQQERIQAKLDRRPAPATEDVTAEPGEVAWRRIDLRSASVMFPGMPDRQVLTLEEWRKQTGIERDSSESLASIGTTGSVFEYRRIAAGGVDLSITEILSRGGVKAGREERLERLRAKLLRAEPLSVLDESRGRSGRFLTLRLLARGENGHARFIVAVGPARKRQPVESPDVIMYVVRAAWVGDDEETPGDAERFLVSANFQ